MKVITAAIIVVNYNNKKLTQNCLDSLKLVKNPIFKVFLVDNSAKSNQFDETIEQQYPFVKLLISESNIGFTGGNNLGIAYAKKNYVFDFLLLLNNDTIVDPDFLKILIRSYTQQPEIGAITPKIYFLHDKTAIWSIGGRINFWLGSSKSQFQHVKDNGQFKERLEVDYITGCCLMVSYDVLEKIGPLNNKFFAYYEDTDWSMKIKKLGLKLICEPSSKIWHVAGASTKKSSGGNSPIVWYLNLRNSLWFFKKYSSWYQKPSFWLVFIIKTSLILTYFLLKWKRDKIIACMKGIREGITERI